MVLRTGFNDTNIEQLSRDDLKILRHADVCKKLGISPSKLFAMIAAGSFPAPFKLIPQGRAVGWVARDVDTYIIERRRASYREAL